MSENDQQQPEPTTAGSDEEIVIKNDDGSVNWQQAARKWEREAKRIRAELEPKAQQFEALTEASKSELQRIQEQADTYREQLEAAQREAMVSAVALDKGLPAALARRLQGSTREELEADAAELLAQFPQSNEPRSPRIDPSQGSSARGGGAKTPAEQFAAILQGQ